MVPELLILVLDYHRAPLRYPQLSEADRALPAVFEGLLGDLGAVLLPQRLERVAQRLRLTPAEIEEAVRFFVRHVLLAPTADHYRVLGLSHGASPETIRRHYHLLVRLFHPDRLGGDAWFEGIEGAETARLNAAYRTLRDPLTRSRYDAEAADSVPPPPLPPEAFRPDRPIGPLFAGRRRRWRWAWPIAGGVAAVIVVALLLDLLSTARRPTLRMNPELAEQTEAKPAYLTNRSAETASPPVAQPPATDASDAPVARLASLTRALVEERPAPEGPTVSAGETATTPAQGAGRPPGSTVQAKAEDRRPVQAEDSASVETLAVPPRPVGGRAQVDTRPAAPASSEPRERALPQEETVTRRPPLTADNVPVERSPAPRRPDAGPAQVDPAPQSSERRGRAAQREEVAPAAAGAGRVSPAADWPTGVADLIGRLERAYERGDAGRFAQLFTANAVINEGQGRRFIRALYGDFFRETTARWLIIGPWRLVDHTPLVVEARRARLGVKDAERNDWRYLHGAFRFELVPIGDEWRFVKMIYDLKPG